MNILSKVLNKSVIFLWFLASLTAYSQSELLHNPSQYNFLEIEKNSLLMGVIIQDITKDHHGFMWFATFEGLVRYDGHELKIYESDPLDEQSLSNKYVTGLQVDSSGFIWVTTRNGLNKFDPIQESFERYYFNQTSDSIERSNWFNTLLIDSHDNLWLGTFEEGLLYFDTQSKEFTQYNHDPLEPTSIHSNQVFSLAFDHEGTLWVGGGNRGSLQYFDSEESCFHQVMLDDPLIVIPDILDIEVTNSGDIWCATWNEGIYVYQPIDGTTLNYRHDENDEHSVSGNIIQRFYEEEDGTIWVSVRSKGIDLFNPSTHQFSHLRHNPALETSLPSNTISHIYGDDKGLLWFSTIHNGVFYYDPEFVYFDLIQSDQSISNGLNSNLIYSMICDRDNKLWIGTNGGGINILDLEHNTFSHMLPDDSTKNSISTSTITALLEDSEGKIWMGNWNTSKILDVYDPKTNTFEHVETELIGDDTNSTTVRTITEDQSGNIWVGTSDNGIYVIQKETKEEKQYTPTEGDSSSLGSRSILALLSDRQNRIWAGTDNRGISRYDSEMDSFDSFRYSNMDLSSINSDKVQCIYEDSLGTIWFGTDNGICRWNEDTGAFVRYLYRLGFQKIDVRGIIEDDANRLWLSTKKGALLCLDSTYEILYTFTSMNGVQPQEFMTGSVCETSTGLLCFAGLSGLNIADPKQVDQSQSIPPVVLTSLSTPNEKISLPSFNTYPQPFHFISSQNHLTFSFAALSYTQSENNQYGYLLSPVDTEWKYTGNETMVSFAALEPGEYTFNVKAADHQSNWNDEGISVPFVIHPPWWKSWWFTVSLFVVFGLFIAAFYTWRMYAIKENNRKLAYEVERKTTDISTLNQNLLHRNEELEDALSHIKTLRGIIPICTSCKKIRDDEGFWDQVETYMTKHSEALFSHGYCPDCLEKEMKSLEDDFKEK